MENWDDHRLILALHRHGTLRATGEALSVTHTTIARRLAALEAAEPEKLFIRQDRAYRVTPYGAERVALAEEMERLHLSATRVKRGAGGDMSGPLTLSVPQAVMQSLLVDTLLGFAADYPEIDLRIVGSDRLSDLDRGEADVVVRGQASPPDHLVGRRICTVGLGHYAHRDYLDSTAPETRRWIAPHRTDNWLAQTPFPHCPIGLVIDDIPSRFLALQKGWGLSRAACFMAAADPNLIRLDPGPAIPLYGLWVLTHPDLRTSAKVQCLMRVISDALASQKEAIEG